MSKKTSIIVISIVIIIISLAISIYIPNRDKIEKEELPSDIQKFLKPEPVVESKEQVIGNNPVEEYLDIKVPEVVSI